MKLKRRIIGAITAAAIIVPTLATTVGCSCDLGGGGDKPTPPGPGPTPSIYTPPTIQYVGGNSFYTEEGKNTYTISGFTADRSRLSGETYDVEFISTDNNNDVTLTGTVSDEGNNIKVNVTMNGVSTQEVVKSFKVKFNFKKGSDSGTQTISNVFTLTFVPEWQDYKITVASGQSPSVSTQKGNRTFSMKFKLDRKLGKQTTIDGVETNNTKVSATGYSINPTTEEITVTYSVSTADEYTPGIEQFKTYFKFSYYGKANRAKLLNDEQLSVSYTALWRPITIAALGLQGDDPEIALNNITDVTEVTYSSIFQLSRTLESDETLTMEIIGEDSDEFTNASGYVLSQENNTIINLHMVIDTTSFDEATSHTYNFGVKFTISKEGETSRVTTFNHISFRYIPSWQKNDVTDTQIESGRKFTTAAGKKSVSVTQRFKLDRNVVTTDGETLDVNVINSSNVIATHSIVAYGTDYYVDINLTLNITSIDHDQDFTFNLEFVFKKANVVKKTVTLPVEGNPYILHFTHDENELSLPASTTGKAGDQFFKFDGSLKNPLSDEIESVTVADKESNEHVLSVSIYRYYPNEKRINFEIRLNPNDINADESATITLTITLKNGTVISGDTILNYTKAEVDPGRDQTISSYIHDRSFSAIGYKTNKTTGNVSDLTVLTGWIVGHVQTPIIEGADITYAYYVVLPYTETVKLATAYATTAETEEFHLGVADGNMQRQYGTYYEDGEELPKYGLDYENDYMMLDPYYSFDAVDPSNYLWSDSNPVGTAGIYIGRINFAYVVGATDAQHENGGAMDITFKNKLTKLNGWSMEGQPYINFMEAPQTEQKAWDADEIVQGGFPTTSLTKDNTSFTGQWWYEGWWHTDGGGSFTTTYYAKDSTSNPYNSRWNVYRWLDQESSLRHYTPLYTIYNIGTNSLPLLCPGSILAYRDKTTEQISVIATYFNYYKDFSNKYVGCYDVLQTDKDTNIISNYALPFPSE